MFSCLRNGMFLFEFPKDVMLLVHNFSYPLKNILNMREYMFLASSNTE